MSSTIGRLAVCTVLFCVPAAAAERIEALEPHMGTMFRIVLYAEGEKDAGQARDAIRAAFDRVAELDNKLSDYKPDSELNTSVQAAFDREIPISDDLYVVLKASRALAESTDGAFDVTLGPVIRLWRKARAARQLPGPDELANARLLTGYRKMHLGDHTLRVDRAGMQFDLGAIAKGYAADEALRLLAARGFPRSLVAASGDLAIGDAPPNKEGWEIGVDSMQAPDQSFTRTLRLQNAGVSTSGDTEQHAEIGGVRYSHIVNPATGLGLMHRIGVTVIARKAIDSDCLSTAASVATETRGSSAALALIQRRGAKGIIVAESGGKMTVIEE
ncbi:MAG: FAD:protein FMN transferase [Acidobacteriota bacterium]